MYHQLDDGDDDGLTDMVRALLPTTTQKDLHTPHITTNTNPISSMAALSMHDSGDGEESYTPPTSRTREVSPSRHATNPTHQSNTTTTPPALESPSLPHRTVVPSRTYASGRLNTISNRYCAGAEQSPSTPTLQGTSYTDRRQELYALMGYEEAVPTTTSVSPVRGGSLELHNSMAMGQSPAIRRPPSETSPPTALLQYHSPQGSRRRDASRTLPREMPLKAPSIFPSPIFGRPRHVTSTVALTNIHHRPTPPPTPATMRLFGNDRGHYGSESSKCRGTKAGPSAEVAAARSLFALLVAEEERVGAALRSGQQHINP